MNTELRWGYAVREAAAKLDASQGDDVATAQTRMVMAQDSLPTVLSAISLFRPLERRKRLALEAASRERRVEKGDVLGEEAGDELLVLLSGAAALNVVEGDRMATLSAVSGPAVLNLPDVIANADCQIRWRLLQAGQVLTVPGAMFRSLLVHDAGLAARACRDLAAGHQQLLTQAADQRLRSGQSRVAHYLLSLAPAAQSGGDVVLPYGKHVLASLLGMTPENLSRMLARLAHYGVSVQGASVRIASTDRLRAAVEASA